MRHSRHALRFLLTATLALVCACSSPDETLWGPFPENDTGGAEDASAADASAADASADTDEAHDADASGEGDTATSSDAVTQDDADADAAPEDASASDTTANDAADEDTANDAVEDTAGDTAEDTSSDTAGDTAQDTPGDTAQDTAQDTAEDTSSDTAGDTSSDTAGDTSSDTAGDTSSDTAEDTSAPIAWEEGRNTFEHDGRSRTVLLELPEVVPPGAPLVLAFHGYTDSASSLRSYSGLGDLARSEGFVVAYPSGTRDAFGNRFFNVGYDFQDEDVDDAGFARALAGQLVRDLGLDFSRVFVTGMSNGGDFAYLLACEPDPFVRAVAPVAGMMLDTIGADCADDGRISIAEFHGTADDVTYYGGDPTNADGWGAYAGMGELMSFFVSRYALEAFETRSIPSTRNAVTLQRWSTTSDDTEVRLYRIDGGGHVWPSVSGEGFSASEELWSFFSSFASERIE